MNMNKKNWSPHVCLNTLNSHRIYSNKSFFLYMAEDKHREMEEKETVSIL